MENINDDFEIVHPILPQRHGLADQFAGGGDSWAIGAGGGGDADNRLGLPIARLQTGWRDIGNGDAPIMLINADQQPPMEAREVNNLLALRHRVYGRLVRQEPVEPEAPLDAIQVVPAGAEQAAVPVAAALRSSSSATALLKAAAESDRIVRFFTRIIFSAAMHPYEYARVLMQLGYEPLPAIACKNLLGKSVMVMPNVHQYLKYIIRIDGFRGIFRGLTARLVCYAASALCCDMVNKFIGMDGWKPGGNKRYQTFLWTMSREVIRLCTAAVVMHPFYVISHRQMAAFIGHESIYDTFFGSIMEIFRNEGWCGFYAGFVPRLLFDVGVLFAVGSANCLINRVFQIVRFQKYYNAVVIQFIAAAALYPLQVSATCMSCTGARLIASWPPLMPFYQNWRDCLMDLYARGHQGRGFLLFWRLIPRIHMRCTEGTLLPLTRIVF